MSGSKRKMRSESVWLLRKQQRFGTQVRHRRWMYREHTRTGNIMTPPFHLEQYDLYTISFSFCYERCAPDLNLIAEQTAALRHAGQSDNAVLCPPPKSPFIYIFFFYVCVRFFFYERWQAEDALRIVLIAEKTTALRKTGEAHNDIPFNLKLHFCFIWDPLLLYVYLIFWWAVASGRCAKDYSDC